MLQSGVVILEQNPFYFLFWRVKSDPSIKISALLIDCRDLIRMTSMLALETLKHIAFAVRLVQITAFWTCLRGVCRIDLLSTTTCRRRLKLESFFQHLIDGPIDLIRDRDLRPTLQLLRLLVA